MPEKTAAKHLTEALNRLTRTPHPLAPPETVIVAGVAGEEGIPAHPAFTIAISREAGAGGITVAREIGSRLGWPVFDHELMAKLAGELNVDVTYVQDYDEHRGSWLVDTIKAFSTSSASVSEVSYFHRLVKILQALGLRGECIVVGRGSNFILPQERTLRVRIVASRNDRIAYIAKDRNLPNAEAARYVDTKDRDRHKFIKDHFHKEPDDPLNYDLMVNRSRFPIDETAQLIIGALHRMQVRKPG
jgi:cytidylate kinase